MVNVNENIKSVSTKPYLSDLKEKNVKLEKQVSNLFNIISIMNELTLTLNFNEILRNLLDILVVSIGSKRHSIALLDNAGMLKVIASKFCDDEVNYEHVLLIKGIINEVFNTKKVYVADDIYNSKEKDIIACIPLIVQNKIIGIIIIHELLSHKKKFTDEDRELFDLVSMHAGYSLIATRVFEKSKKDIEKRDKQVTKLYDVFNLVSSAVDINEVLDIVINTAKELLDCDIIAIMLYDEEKEVLALRNSIGLDPKLINNYYIKIGDGISGKVFKTKKPVLIKDTEHEIRYSGLLKTNEASFYSGSILSVPIMIIGKPIGIISISKLKGRKSLDVPEKKLLTTLAAQAAVGLNNTYLYEKQEKELIKVSGLLIALNQLHTTLDLNEIYKIANNLLVDFIGANVFSIMLKDISEKELVIVLSRGINENLEDRIRIPIGKGIIGNAVKEGKSFILSANQSPPIIKLANKDFKLFACIPLRIENKIVGAIIINELSSQKSNFIQFDKELFDLMAQHTAIAIIRSQLFAKSEQKTSSLYDISRLLAIKYDLQNSLNTTLKLIHKNIKNIKSAVFIFDEIDHSKYKMIAQVGYSVNKSNKLEINEKKDAHDIPIFYNRNKIGLFRIEKKSRGDFSIREIDALQVTANLIAQFIYHDKTFKISKKLAIMLSKEKAQSNAIVKGVADGLLVTDIQNNIILINPTVEKLFSFKERDAIGYNFKKFIPDKNFESLLSICLKENYAEKKIKIKINSKQVFLDVKTSLVRDDNSKPVGIVTIMHNRTKEAESNKVKSQYLRKLRKISITDPLTNIYNRRYFKKRLNEEFTRSQRYNNDISFIMIDIDYFKNINDTYGHAVGDTILKGVANSIKEHIREIDLLARYGGDEFVLIFPQTNANNAYYVANRLKEFIANKIFKTTSNKIKLTISLGLCSYPNSAITTSNDLVKFADNALYEAKQSGRNKIVIYKTK